MMASGRRASADTVLRLGRLSTPASLKEQAYVAIKRAILSLDLEPGEALVEADLAQQLGISKTPVRTALHELEREGLVTKVLYKGTYVTEITLRDVQEIFQIRAALEGLAARLAAPVIEDSELAEAQQLLRVMEEALDRGDNGLASQCGASFHEVILQQADNQRLQLIVHNLDDHLQRYRLLSDSIRGRLRKSLGEHRAVLIALQGRDPDLAEQRLRGHLDSVLAELLAEPPLGAHESREEDLDESR
jgi:DNA-binding GntR family transcriptional regulator